MYTPSISEEGRVDIDPDQENGIPPAGLGRKKRESGEFCDAVVKVVEHFRAGIVAGIYLLYVKT